MSVYDLGFGSGRWWKDEVVIRAYCKRGENGVVKR